jgi:hypothetical protein
MLWRNGRRFQGLKDRQARGAVSDEAILSLVDQKGLRQPNGATAVDPLAVGADGLSIRRHRPHHRQRELRGCEGRRRAELCLQRASECGIGDDRKNAAGYRPGAVEQPTRSGHRERGVPGPDLGEIEPQQPVEGRGGRVTAQERLQRAQPFEPEKGRVGIPAAGRFPPDLGLGLGVDAGTLTGGAATASRRRCPDRPGAHRAPCRPGAHRAPCRPSAHRRPCPP